MKHINCFSGLLSVFWACEALASPTILQFWQATYPESRSADRECQLCHVKTREEGGGEPWNTYGYEIRDNYISLYGREDIVAAIRQVEINNSDNDSENLTNLEEINLGLDPGWAPGPVNTHIYKDGNAIINQEPPFLEVLPTIADDQNSQLCFAVKISKGVTTICL